jgi:hypothetical protein
MWKIFGFFSIIFLLKPFLNGDYSTLVTMMGMLGTCFATELSKLIFAGIPCLIFYKDIPFLYLQSLLSLRFDSARGKGVILLVIKTHGGERFGSYTAEPLTRKPGFYGSASNFIFSLSPQLAVYSPTGYNQNYQVGTRRSIFFVPSVFLTSYPTK